MASALIAYASTHGQTEKIAGKLAERLRIAGHEPELANLCGGADPDPADFDGLILAASVHREAHQSQALEWVKRRRPSVSPSAFISVTLTAAQDSDEARSETTRLRDAFLAETEWSPDKSVCWAGALQYREYDFFTRTLVRLLMKKGGHPTDTSQDYDYTDWDEVVRFGDEFSTAL